MEKKAFRFGVSTTGATSRSAWIALAQRVEQLGYSSLLVSDSLGTPYASIYPGAALIGTVETIRGRIAEYEAVGAQELVVGFRNTSLDQVRRFAEEFINK